MSGVEEWSTCFKGHHLGETGMHDEGLCRGEEEGLREEWETVRTSSLCRKSMAIELRTDQVPESRTFVSFQSAGLWYLRREHQDVVVVRALAHCWPSISNPVIEDCVPGKINARGDG